MLKSYVDSENYPGWQLIHLRSLKAISKNISDPLYQNNRTSCSDIVYFGGASVFFLYRKASLEISQRNQLKKL